MENVRFYKEEEKNDVEFSRKVKPLFHISHVSLPRLVIRAPNTLDIA